MNDKKRQILDHGYLQYIEHWGSDERIIEAARMSTNKGFLGWEAGPCPVCLGTKIESFVGGSLPCFACEGKGSIPGDKGLLRRLHTKKHTTPFEMGGLIVEVQAPIMVFREWHRHRTQSYNEMSARYTPLPNLNYIPTVERLMMGVDASNKQSGTIKGAKVLTEVEAKAYQVLLGEMYRQDQLFYERALADGIPKELARIHLPVGRYSRMRASANLLNWLKFLVLRMAPDAQWEIREYANAIGDLISKLFPKTWALFIERQDNA